MQVSVLANQAMTENGLWYVFCSSCWHLTKANPTSSHCQPLLHIHKLSLAYSCIFSFVNSKWTIIFLVLVCQKSLAEGSSFWLTLERWERFLWLSKSWTFQLMTRDGMDKQLQEVIPLVFTTLTSHKNSVKLTIGSGWQHLEWWAKFHCLWAYEPTR